MRVMFERIKVDCTWVQLSQVRSDVRIKMPRVEGCKGEPDGEPCKRSRPTPLRGLGCLPGGDFRMCPKRQ
jgi:hypothetical protein